MKEHMYNYGLLYFLFGPGAIYWSCKFIYAMATVGW